MPEAFTPKATADTRCGFVAIAGRSNVGKSTLLNRILGQKISITARRPQTTRHRIRGIKTLSGCQAVYVDTPGFHRREQRLLGRYMNRTADSALRGVDLVLLVAEAYRFTAEDERLVQRLHKRSVPVVLILNKVDRVSDKTSLLPRIDELSKRMAFAAIIPMSARKGDNVVALEQKVAELLPAGSMVFPEDQLTDRNERFLAAELIREKLTRHLGQELPYALTVFIESFEEARHGYRIAATIYVERPGQKAIVIGKDGTGLKRVGREARLDMERIFECKVYLDLWVKVRPGWPSDENLLRSLGYGDR